MQSSGLPLLLLLGDIAFVALHILFRDQGFDLDAEMNLPTLYQVIKLLVLGMFLFWLIRRNTRSLDSAGAALLAAIFFYLGLDEWWQIHERVSDLTHRFLTSIGMQVPFAAWLLPYSVLGLLWALAVVLLYNTFKQSDSQHSLKTRKLLIAASACFLLVPLAEIAGTWEWQLESILYPFWVALEEGLEMIGASLYFAAFWGLRRQKE